MEKRGFFLALESLVVGIAVIAVRIMTHPGGVELYGYDYGWYSHALKHLPSGLMWAGWFQNDYSHIFFVFNKLLRLPHNLFLDGSFLFFTASATCLLYAYLRKYSISAAIVGAFLFVFSPAQTSVYNYFLYKQQFALVALIALLSLIESKRYRWAWVPAMLIVIGHKTTLAISILSATVWSFTKVSGKQLLVSLGVIALTAIILLWPLDGAIKLQALLNTDYPSGYFISPKQYLVFYWPVLLFGAYGFFLSIKNKTHAAVNSLFIVSCLWVSLTLPFYKRILPFMDLASIILASYWLNEQMISRKKRWIIFTLLITASLMAGIYTKQELIKRFTREQIEEIKLFSKLHQDGFVVTPNTEYASILLGNLDGKIRLSAPGLFEEVKNRNQWDSFFDNVYTIEFFEPFPKPLFLYGNHNYNDDVIKCLKPVSVNFQEFLCK